MTHTAREARDVQKAKLEKLYAPKLARLQERIRKAQARVEKEKSQYDQQKLQSAISIGATVLGALLGRKTSSVGRATTAVRGMGRAARERGDISRAAETVEALNEKLAELEAEFDEALAELRDTADPGNLELEKIDVRPRKSDISVSLVALLWMPWRLDADGVATPAYE